MHINTLLNKLPPYQNRQMLIEKKQTVGDIVSEVLAAHNVFANDYNFICADFWQGTGSETAKQLFYFLKTNIRYDEEPESSQTTRSPAAILALGHGDCKHYAGFIGGVLDGINRRFNRGLKWAYRFASYNGDNSPGHVFIVLKEDGREYWIDPVLKYFNERLIPTGFIDKKIKNNMALKRISGVEDLGQDIQPEFLISDTLEASQDNPDLYFAIQLLLKNGVMDANAKVNDGELMKYQNSDPKLFSDLYNARLLVGDAAIGGLFSTIWRGVKKITLAIPRAAFLSLVSVNAFGYATKLKNSVYNKDGSATSFKDKLKDVWQNKLGGDWAVLQNTINNGATKKAILGVAPAIPAWVAAASAVVAAIMPLVSAFLKTRPAEQMTFDPGIDPATGLPYGNSQMETTAGGVVDFIKNNPIVIIGGIAAIYFLIKKKTA